MRTKSFYTAITTDNMEKTKEFYIGLLGFHKAHEVITESGRAVVLENDEGAKLDIIETPGVPGAFSALRTNVSDLNAAIAEITQKGYEILMGPADISTGKAVLVKDPNGIVITIMQHIKKENRGLESGRELPEGKKTLKGGNSGLIE